MEIQYFCKGSKKLAIKYRYYLKYYVMIAISFFTPITLLVLEHYGWIQFSESKFGNQLLILIFLVWFTILMIGLLGRNGVTALRYQIFGITKDGKLIHFWFKDLLRDGKVVLRFKPYHKKEIREEFIEIIKRKEEIIKDVNFEDYLSVLCNDEAVQKRSDILFEMMYSPVLEKETKKYIVVSYIIGELNTKKKIKIYKNITNYDRLIQLIKRES